MNFQRRHRAVDLTRFSVVGLCPHCVNDLGSTTVSVHRLGTSLEAFATCQRCHLPSVVELRERVQVQDTPVQLPTSKAGYRLSG